MDTPFYGLDILHNDHLPSHQKRIPRGGHVEGNGRPDVMGFVQYIDMENSFPRAKSIWFLVDYKAQSDAITWV